jgi:hypothetical protein
MRGENNPVIVHGNICGKIQKKYSAEETYHEDMKKTMH